MHVDLLHVVSASLTEHGRLVNISVNLYTLVSGHFILEAHNYLLARKCRFAGSSHQATAFVLLSLQTRTDKSSPLYTLFRPQSRALAVLPLFSFFANPLLQPPSMIHEMLSR